MRGHDRTVDRPARSAWRADAGRRRAARGVRQAQRRARLSLVPGGRRAASLSQPAAACRRHVAGARICPVGHVADLPRQRQRAARLAGLSRPCRDAISPTGGWSSTGWSRGRWRCRCPTLAASRNARRLRATIASRGGARSASGRARSWARSCAPRACRAAPISSSSTAPTRRAASLITSRSTSTTPSIRRPSWRC